MTKPTLNNYYLRWNLLLSKQNNFQRKLIECNRDRNLQPSFFHRSHTLLNLLKTSRRCKMVSLDRETVVGMDWPLLWLILSLDQGTELLIEDQLLHLINLIKAKAETSHLLHWWALGIQLIEASLHWLLKMFKDRAGISNPKHHVLSVEQIKVLNRNRKLKFNLYWKVVT